MNMDEEPKRAQDPTNKHDAEKKAVERATAEGFLAAYNRIAGTAFSVEKVADAPDIHCVNIDGQRMFLEVRVFGDAPGTPAYMLGRGPDPLEGEGKPPSYCLQTDTLSELRKALSDKATNDYGSDVALVLRYVGRIWSPQDIATLTIEKDLSEKAQRTFKKGVWVFVSDEGAQQIV